LSFRRRTVRVGTGRRIDYRDVFAAAFLCPLLRAGYNFLQPGDLVFFRFTGDWARVHDTGISGTTIQSSVWFRCSLWRGRGHRLLGDGRGFCRWCGGLGGNGCWLGRSRRVPLSLTACCLNNYIDTLFIFPDDGQSSAGSLQQGGQFSFDKPLLFVGIAHMAERRAHIENATHLAPKQNIVTTQMNFGRFAGSLQLL
jgi:hypothetical protein